MSSPLVRAARTAAALAAVTGVAVATDARLAERAGGKWEGLTDVEIRERYPAEHQSWEPPGGETERAVAARVSAGVRAAAAGCEDGGTLVVASHGAAIRAGIARLIDVPMRYGDRLGPLSNACWSVLEPMGPGRSRRGWRLVEHNAGSLPAPVLSDDQ